MKNKRDILISLFDYSMSWSLFYDKAGYHVIQVDLKRGTDILKWNYKKIDRSRVAGVIAAPPCTDYTVSCNRLWPEKDRNGTTAKSNALISKTLEIIAYFMPENETDEFFWSLENPGSGRLARMLAGNYVPGEPRINIPARLVAALKKPALKFNPSHYGDPWTKQTCLWGRFNKLVECPTAPIQWAPQGSWTQLLGGKSERTKEIRSVTPSGFGRAFFDANNPLGNDIGQHINLFGTCKYGEWTCHFAVCQEICEECVDRDNYEPDEYAMQFDTEGEYMKAIFDKGNGIYKMVDPKSIHDNKSFFKQYSKKSL